MSERILDGAKMAETMADFVNCTGYREAEEFAQAMMRQHRTLQQGVMSVFCAYVEALAIAHKNQRFDLRNQASCELATAIEKLPEYHYRMPLI